MNVKCICGVCKKDHLIEITKEEFIAMRQKCTVYTRVMGYHRPVESFNVGKTGEHKQRKQFEEH